jgi:putative NADH-flavin reductase
MSNIAIIGATGRAGSQLLEEALRRGHSVTAIARDTSKISQRAGVVTRNVDALDASAVIGPVKKAGVKCLLVVGGAGSLLLPDGTRVIDSDGFPEFFSGSAPAPPATPSIHVTSAKVRVFRGIPGNTPVLL